MLYVFHGTDISTSVKKAHAVADSLRAKRPDAAFVEVVAGQWSPSLMGEHIGGQGLFSSKYIILLNRVTENAEAKESLSAFIQAMNGSPNILILREGKLNAELKRAVDAGAEKSVVSDLKEAAPKKEFNAFGLADAFGRGEAFKAWSMYRQAIDGGSEPEAIVGMLFWKAKTMSSAPLARKLLTMYHESHRGRLGLELAAERLVLDCGKQEV